LFFRNGDWAYACCDQTHNNFPVVNINSISTIFEQLLAAESPANNAIAITLTDFTAALDPDTGNCCALGFHAVQPGVADPSGILVWAWASFLPQTNDPFGPDIADITALSHEITELHNDPFANTKVAPWVDGSVSFAQGNLKTSDVIEEMNSTI